MRAVIIDDDELNIELIDFFCITYADSVEVVGVAESVEEGIAVMQYEKPDLVFLDIELGIGTGFDILLAIDQPEVMVIITSAFDQYDLERINICLIDYLLKPLHIPQFVLAIEKCQAEYDKRNKLEEPEIGYRSKSQKSKLMTVIPQSNSSVHLSIDTIFRIESKKKQTRIYTNDMQTIETSLTIDDLENLLPPYLFLRVHPSHIVHIKSIISLDISPKSFLIMNDQTKLPVSASLKKKIAARLSRF